MLCCQVEHAQHLSKTYAKVRFPSNKIEITLLQKLVADNDEMNFLYEHNLPKDLKRKRSVAVSFAAKP